MSASVDFSAAPATRRKVDRTSWIVFAIILVLTGGALVAMVVLSLPWQLVLVLPILLALVLVVRAPVIGFFGLFAAALLVPVQGLGYADSLTDGIPFWLNLSDATSLNISGLGITPAEILMAVVFVGLLAARAASRQSWPKSKLMWPYLAFGLAVIIGEVNGLIHGGDFKLSLWELRPQAYGLAMFVMGTILLRERAQLTVLVVLLLVSEIYKGVVGVNRYFITVGQEVAATLPNIQAHEESYLLALFLTAVAVGLIWFRRPLMVLLVAVSPVVFVAIVVNHRRAGLAALFLEIVTVIFLAYIAEPRYRRHLLVAATVMAVVGTAFVVTFWNQPNGSIAEMIRPIKSLIDPSARDLSSDQYRIAETLNLKATFRTSPIFGVGFGHPYYIFYPQTGVANIDPLWNIIPHNTVLWIPMRMGVIGLVTFWALISMIIIQTFLIVRTVRDKFVLAVSVFALAGIVGELFTGYYDIGLENYRNLAVFGVLIAIINRAPDLAGAATGHGDREQSGLQRPTSPADRS